MTKVAYEIVSLEVEKLYAKTINDNEIAQHCHFISEFIESCGWNADTFFLMDTSKDN